MSEERVSVPMNLGSYGAPVLSMIAGEMVTLLQEHGAPNFLGFQIPRPDGDLMLTIRRVNGETPEAQCRRLRERVKVLEDAIQPIIHEYLNGGEYDENLGALCEALEAACKK